MKNVDYFNTLFDTYKELLTEKEKEFFSLYYEEDYTLQEIADNNHISKSAVGKKIQIAEKKLEKMESILSVVAKTKLLEEISEITKEKGLKDKIKNVIEKIKKE